MKKLWVVALASVGFLLSAPSLYAAADIKFDGDFRVRGIYADNLSDANKDRSDEQAFADGRFRLKTTATAGIIAGIVTLDFTSSFSDPTQTGARGAADCTATGCTTGNYRFGSANFGGSYNIVGVREAYLKLDLHLVKLAFGRKQLKLGHSLILDDTVDTVAGKFTAGPLEIMLADAKLLDTNSTVATAGGATGSDTDLYIAKFGFAHGEMHNLGLFVTYLLDRGPSFIAPTAPAVGDSTNLWTAGVTADAKLGVVNLAGEFDYLTGSLDTIGGGSADLRGWNALVDAGLKVAMFDVDVTGLYTTGQKATGSKVNVNGISGDFVLANILVNDNIRSDREGQCASIAGARLGSGGRDCVGGLGIRAIRVGAGFELGMLGKGSRSEVAAIWAQTAQRPVIPVLGAGKKDLGIEIDVNHRQKLDENVAVNVNLGYLMAGDAWKTFGATAAGLGPADAIMKGIISLNYMF